MATASTVDAAVATWTANTEPDIAGYKLSYGTQSGVHTVVLDTGKVTTFTFSPPPGFKYFVVIQAYNSSGQLSDKSAEVTFDIPVTTAAPAAPTLVQPANQSTMLETNVLLQLSYSAAPGRVLTFTANGLPPGLSINASGLISGVTKKVGNYAVTATVADGTLTASKSFTWTVVDDGSGRAPGNGNGNKPGAPTLDDPGNQVSVVNTSASLKMSASGTGTLNFIATGLPAGLSINSSTGVISGVPTIATTYNVIVTVNNGSQSDSTNFTWQIVNSGGNRPPTLTQPANQTSTVDQRVTLALVATDPEGDRVNFTATGLPPGLSINRNTGVISGTPDTAGTYQVVATASDGTGTHNRSFTWVVSDQGAASSANRLASPETTKPADGEGNSDASAATRLDFVGVPGDFDGDGRSDLATYRSSSGEWRILTSSSKFQEATVFTWGDAGDLPMPADYNGDRVTDLALYRPSTGTWHLFLSHTQTPVAVHWGGPDDRPVTLDHDGDGKADLAVIRGAGYAILLSSTNYTTSVTVQ